MATRILIIEDDQDQLELTTSLVDKAGYIPLVARDGVMTRR